MLNMFFANLKVLPVIVGTITSVAIGMTWYSPLLVGNMWMKEVKIKEPNMHAGHIIGAILINFVLVLGFSYFSYLLNITSIARSIELALIIWSAFIASTFFSASIWANQSITLYLIDSGHWLAVLLGISIVTTLF